MWTWLGMKARLLAADLASAFAFLPAASSLLYRFLDEVQSHSNVNKMSVQNLATVFGPNILRPQIEDPVTIMEGNGGGVHGGAGCCPVWPPLGPGRVLRSITLHQSGQGPGRWEGALFQGTPPSPHRAHGVQHEKKRNFAL